MTVTSINTSDLQIYRHPRARVYVADKLQNLAFVEVPYLRCDRLRIAAGPEIDQCQLSYVYGKILQDGNGELPLPNSLPARYNPLDLVGKFVKVEIVDTVFADESGADWASSTEYTEGTAVKNGGKLYVCVSAGTSDTGSGPTGTGTGIADGSVIWDYSSTDLTVRWYGVIEYDDREPSGTTPAPENQPQGHQQITAYGILRLLSKRPIDTSLINVDDTEDNAFEAKRGLPFNLDPGGPFVQRGNRSANKVSRTDTGKETYLFSWTTRGQDKWTAYTAVEYLLNWQCPNKTDGTPANTWKFVDGTDSDMIDWYEIAEHTDGRTVKDLLDTLIPRYRGVGYFAKFDPETNECHIHLFTFNKTAIDLPDGETLPANPNLRSLDFEHAYDIESVNVGNVETQKYHRVIARGAKRTTTFTTRIGARGAWNDSVACGPSWTSVEETEYKNGAYYDTDYHSLTTEQKENRNSIARSSDRLREVFRRYVLNCQIGESTRWNCQIGHPHSDDWPWKYWLRGEVRDAAIYNRSLVGGEYDGRDYIPGLRIRRHLPLYERIDYSDDALESFDYKTAITGETYPSFVPLMAYARTFEGDGEPADISEGQTPHRYELLDKLHEMRFSPTSNRDWSCHVMVTDTEPGFELIPGLPHYLAGPDAGSGTGWAATAKSQLSSQHGGIFYTDIWVTMCVELSEHAEQSITLAAPAEDAPQSVLILNAPECRHDYVLPHTTVEIKSGLPIETTTGGAARDDLKLLLKYATTGAQWYSTVRQTLNLKWKQLRMMFELGHLITDVGGQYQLTDINTPITAIQFDLGYEHGPGGEVTGSTYIETAFTNLDFSK